MLCDQLHVLAHDTKVYFSEDVIELLVRTTLLNLGKWNEYQILLLYNQITYDVESELFGIEQY